MTIQRNTTIPRAPVAPDRDALKPARNASLDGHQGAPAPLSLSLPWPPSINHYWRAVNIRGAVRKIISKAGREWNVGAERELILQRPRPVKGSVAIHIELTPPNRRLFDLDNRVKVLLDLLVKCAVIDGDDVRFLKKITVELCDGGLSGARVTVSPFAG